MTTPNSAPSTPDQPSAPPMSEERLEWIREWNRKAPFKHIIGGWVEVIDELLDEVARLRSGSVEPSGPGGETTHDHSHCGRGDSENGPYDPDCACRGTSEQAACADRGCGFCRAALRSGSVEPSGAASVTRFEVIDHRSEPGRGSMAIPGRTFTAHDCRVTLSYQDDGRTLKVFVDDPYGPSGPYGPEGVYLS